MVYLLSLALTFSFTLLAETCPVETNLRQLLASLDEEPARITGFTVQDRDVLKLFKNVNPAFDKHRQLKRLETDLAELKKKNAPEVAIKNHERKIAQLQQDIKTYNNKFIEGISDLYHKAGIKHHTVKENGVRLLILDLDGPSSNPGVRFFKTIKERYGIKQITISLDHNANNSTYAFFSTDSQRVELGFFQATELAKGKIITVSRHETRHAIFDAFRRTGRDSLFHTLFRGSEEPLNQHKFYSEYMSSEELYTYSTDLQSLARALKNSPAHEIPSTLQQILSEVEGLKKIATTQVDLLKGFDKALKKTLKTDGKHFEVTDDYGPPSIYVIDDKGRSVQIRLVDPEHVKNFQHFKEQQQKLHEGAQSIMLKKLGGPEEFANFFEKYEKNELSPAELKLFDDATAEFGQYEKDYGAALNKVLEVAPQKMRDLRKLSEIQLKEAEKLEALIKQYEASPQESTLIEVQKQMHLIAQNVKERYKGFALKKKAPKPRKKPKP